MQNNYLFKQTFTPMDLANMKEKRNLEDEKEYQKKLNEKLMEWEKENKVSISVVNVPVMVKDNNAKIVIEGHLWFNKLG